MATQLPRKPYKTDVTDAQWAVLEPLIPPAKHGGRPREADMREVVNTLFYQSRTGVQWDLLPHDLAGSSSTTRTPGGRRGEGALAGAGSRRCCCSVGGRVSGMREDSFGSLMA